MSTTPQPPVLSAEALRILAQGKSNGDGELLAKLRDGGWLDRQTFPPLQYAVPGVISEGLALLVAPPKAGKSWLVLGVALAAASGGSALGVLKVDRRPVLYLALEDGDRRMQERCRALLGDDPIPIGLHYLTTVDAGAVLHTIAAWLALHPATAPLVVLDTLGKVMPSGAARGVRLPARLPHRWSAQTAVRRAPRCLTGGGAPRPQGQQRRLHRLRVRYPRARGQR